MFIAQRPQNIQPLLDLVRVRHRRGVRERSRGNRRRGDLLLRLNAAWRSLPLDRWLAEGVDPRTSATLAVRARKLTSPRSRKRTADGLAGALRRAKDTTPGITAAVRPDVRELLDAAPVLTALGRRLRGSDPVTAQGVAMLRGLLTDAGSALYRPSGPGELASRLRAAAAALEPRTGVPLPPDRRRVTLPAICFLDVPDGPRAVEAAELARRPRVPGEGAGR